ncbi:9280_t:CDS:2, partial [Dentiscutata erythropus]
MIRRYVLEDAEYLTLVQTILISTSNDEIEITPDDLPYSSSLLLFFAPVVSNTHFSNNKFGRESLMLSKKLYNGVTGHKNIETEIIVSYTNQNGRYNALKDNLKKTNYASNEQTSNNSNKAKAKAQSDINDYFE